MKMVIFLASQRARIARGDILTRPQLEALSVHGESGYTAEIDYLFCGESTHAMSALPALSMSNK